MTELWSRAGTEPSVEDLLADPICHRIMQHDGISPDDVWMAIRRAGRNRARPQADPASSGHRTAVDYLVEARQMRDDMTMRTIGAGLDAIGPFIRRSACALPHLRMPRCPDLLSRA